MQRSFKFIFAFILASSLAWAQETPVKVIYAKRVDTSPALRDMIRPARVAKTTSDRDRNIDNILPGNSKFSTKPGNGSSVDPALQQGGSAESAATINLNFDGASNADNLAVVGFRVAPPDINADVGPNHIVQTVNLVTTIYDKSGNTLSGPFATNDIWSGFGGNCEFSNDGDPIVVYDPVADRWVVSQFVFSVSQCMAVSATSDPTGAYHRYEFSTPGNDYPKIGMMPDAYYATIRNFSGAFNMDAAAMDRSLMLTGGAATIQIFNLSSLNPDCEGVQPIDLDGPAPPSGTPGLFVGNNCGPALVHNQIDIFQMDVDFANPGNTTFTGPSTVNVSSFDLNQANIPQPSPGPALDDLAFFTMYRVGFRDMGSHFAIVLNHTVDVNDFVNHAGIRWYELRDNTRTGNRGNWTLHQEGTFSPDANHRWMGAIAMNADGDIGLSYTVSSSSLFPSIRVTGRKASDPLGQMTLPEETVIAGTGSQTGTSRWGDYSSLSVDPSNDQTFVGTHEYVQTTGNFNWWTRIFSFDVIPPPPPSMSVTLSNVNPTTFPPGGGALTYKAEITNNGGSPTSGDIWTMVTLPNGNPFGPTRQFNNVPFSPGQTRMGNITENVPPNAPAGTYTYIMNFGTFPNTIIASDQFTFTKTTSPSTSKPAPVATAPAPATGDFADGIAYDWGKLLEEAGITAIPEDFVVEQNYPNPFNPSTVIRYGLSKESHVKVKVFNMLGEEVATLVDAQQSAGFKSVTWNGKNDAGQVVSAGVYMYLVETGGIAKTNKMVFAK